MTEKRWKQIEDMSEQGDPLKDIGVDDGELIEYIIELRKKVSKLKEYEWMYKDLCK